MNIFAKQPADQVDYDVGFSRWLPDGDTITTATATVDVADELAIESTAIDADKQVVKVWLSGGVHGTTYKVTVTASTEGGRIKQTEFKVRVKDT